MPLLLLPHSVPFRVLPFRAGGAHTSHSTYGGAVAIDLRSHMKYCRMLPSRGVVVAGQTALGAVFPPDSELTTGGGSTAEQITQTAWAHGCWVATGTAPSVGLGTILMVRTAALWFP